MWTNKTKTADFKEPVRQREAGREETEAEGLVWQKGKGGGHEAAVERELGLGNG